MDATQWMEDQPEQPASTDIDEFERLQSDDGKAKAPDPFDLDTIRQSQDFGEVVGVRKTLKCKVRKPSKEWWIQTCPDESYRIECPVVELKEENETYWVNPPLWSELLGEPTFVRKALFLYTAKHTWAQGDYFLWSIRLPDTDGKIDDWNRSAMEFALQTGEWQRITANRDLGEYDQFLTSSSWSDPEWPDVSFQELVRAAFKGRLIDSLSHPVIQNLRGE